MDRYYFERQREYKKFSYFWPLHCKKFSSLNKLTSKGLFRESFLNIPVILKEIYFLIRSTTLDTKARMLQYKVLNNILYADRSLFKFGKVSSTRCSFCKLHNETIIHLLPGCLIVKRLWNQLKSILSHSLNFPISLPQSTISGFWSSAIIY